MGFNKPLMFQKLLCKIVLVSAAAFMMGHNFAIISLYHTVTAIVINFVSQKLLQLLRKFL